jgi:benzoyl-CoA 2,3-dioxygenase component B
MFVGQTAVARIVQRTAEIVRRGKDPRKEGVIPFDMLQRYLNFWYTVSLDLFGSEVSTNGASYFAAGLKGRPREAGYPDHVLLDGSARVELLEDGEIVERDVPPRMAVNLQTRTAYQEDCRSAVEKWNKIGADLGVVFRLPSERFHRAVGTFAGCFFDPDGRMVPEAEFRRRETEWLPSETDEAYVRSLMTNAVTEPGRFASWIAPPARGIHAQPIDFEYVRFNEA